MIYINDELQKVKPKEDFEKFKREFASFLDDRTGERLVKPVIIKYIPSIVRPDPKNKGKFIAPRSLDIRHVSQIQVGDSMADVRYTKTAPKRTKDGALEFKEVSTSVVGRLGTTDIDFLFFFWKYSNQNVKNDPENAKLIIENKQREIEIEASVKRNSARIQGMIWNEERFGGVNIAKLVEYARTTKTITGIDEMSDDELRNAIERDFLLDKTAKSKFLDFMYEDKLSFQEAKPKLDIVGRALEANVIAQVNAKQVFCYVDDNGKPAEEIWSWKGSNGFEKPPVKFYNWLEKFEPDTLEKIIALTDEKLAVAE